MREIRQSGSEGGAAGVATGRPYPYRHLGSGHDRSRTTREFRSIAEFDPSRPQPSRITTACLLLDIVTHGSRWVVTWDEVSIPGTYVPGSIPAVLLPAVLLLAVLVGYCRATTISGTAF
jgi:hypothetical protein